MGGVLGVFTRQVSTDRQDSNIASKLCYIAGVFIFVVAVLRICVLQVTEFQLIFGLLLTVGVTIQFLIVGMLLELRGSLKSPPPEAKPATRQNTV